MMTMSPEEEEAACWQGHKDCNAWLPPCQMCAFEDDEMEREQNEKLPQQSIPYEPPF